MVNLRYEGESTPIPVETGMRFPMILVTYVVLKGVGGWWWGYISKISPLRGDDEERIRISRLKLPMIPNYRFFKRSIFLCQGWFPRRCAGPRGDYNEYIYVPISIGFHPPIGPDTKRICFWARFY